MSGKFPVARQYRGLVITEDQEQAILQSFTPDQLALFEHYYTEVLELKADLEYNPESPVEHVGLSGYYRGKLELLGMFLARASRSTTHKE